MELIEALVKVGGSRWQKNGMDRIYFNDVDELYGLDIEYYKTGNICSARLNGESISNAEAHRVRNRLGKVWYDVKEGCYYSKGMEQSDLQIIVNAIKAKAADMMAQA